MTEKNQLQFRNVLQWPTTENVDQHLQFVHNSTPLKNKLLMHGNSPAHLMSLNWLSWETGQE